MKIIDRKALVAALIMACGNGVLAMDAMFDGTAGVVAGGGFARDFDPWTLSPATREGIEHKISSKSGLWDKIHDIWGDQKASPKLLESFLDAETLGALTPDVVAQLKEDVASGILNEADLMKKLRDSEDVALNFVCGQPMKGFEGFSTRSPDGTAGEGGAPMAVSSGGASAGANSAEGGAAMAVSSGGASGVANSAEGGAAMAVSSGGASGVVSGIVTASDEEPSKVISQRVEAILKNKPSVQKSRRVLKALSEAEQNGFLTKEVVEELKKVSDQALKSPLQSPENAFLTAIMSARIRDSKAKRTRASNTSWRTFR